MTIISENRIYKFYFNIRYYTPHYIHCEHSVYCILVYNTILYTITVVINNFIPRGLLIFIRPLLYIASYSHEHYIIFIYVFVNDLRFWPEIYLL